METVEDRKGIKLKTVKGFVIAIAIVCFYVIFLAITIVIIEENEEIWCEVEKKWKRAVLLFTPGLMGLIVMLKFFIVTSINLLNRKDK